MPTYRYRAATSAGGLRSGQLEGLSPADALEQLRRSGLRMIEAVEVKATASGPGRARPLPRGLLAKRFAELAVLVDAGVPLDRSLATVLENIEQAPTRAAFNGLLRSVREGRPLSRALDDAGAAFPPMAAAMTAAGEADGRPAAALAKLSETLERAEALRTTLVSAAVYPAMLLAIAAGVIALMLFWVVPQFETLFSDSGAKLPFMTQLVLGVSRWARAYGLVALAVAIAAGAGAVQLLRRPALRRAGERVLLGVPRLGRLVAMAETARFMRVLASLVQGGVTLPEAVAIARRSLANGVMGEAVDRIAKGLREGQGLTGPLTASGVFPAMVKPYLRTGEETAQLPLMLDRLADALDTEVRLQLQRLVGVLTPLITVAMGAIVATVIASIMTAILGFDDLALTS